MSSWVLKPFPAIASLLKSHFHSGRHILSLPNVCSHPSAIISGDPKVVNPQHLAAVEVPPPVQCVRKTLKKTAEVDVDSLLDLESCCFYSKISNYRVTKGEKICAICQEGHTAQTLLAYSWQSFEAKDAMVAGELAWGAANMSLAEFAKSNKIETSSFTHYDTTTLAFILFYPTPLYVNWKAAESCHKRFYGPIWSWPDLELEALLTRTEKFVEVLPYMKLNPDALEEYNKRPKPSPPKEKQESNQLPVYKYPPTKARLEGDAKRAQWAAEGYANIAKICCQSRHTDEHKGNGSPAIGEDLGTQRIFEDKNQ